MPEQWKRYCIILDLKRSDKKAVMHYRHADGRMTTIPFHSSKELARPLIRVILNEINLTIEEYGELLKDI